MTKKDKIFLAVFGSIALINFYLQYRANKKIHQIKDEIIKNVKDVS